MVSPTAEACVGLPAIGQRWREVSFVHWAYPVEEVQRLVPDELEVDVFGGQAWVGLTPFLTTLELMDRVSLPGSDWFPETNLRTYVRAPDGTDGVWFFSLDVTNVANVALGRAAQPYKWARLSVEPDGDITTYRGERRTLLRDGARYELDVRHEEEDVPADDPLSIFLTGRWHTYSHRGVALLRFDIEHEPWPLSHATADISFQGLTNAARLPDPQGDPIVHFSPGVDVKISPPKLVRSNA